MTQGEFIRGIVSYKDCMKPRCIYSAISPSRMKPHATIGDPETTAQAIRVCREYAMEKIEEAQNNEYYVRGIQMFDAGDPMHGLILAREGLECHHHVEFDYYNNPKILTSSFNAKLCAYCAGSSGADGFVDEELNVVWKSVLHVCQECRANGALPIVRSRRRNDAHIDKRAQHRRLTAIARSQARDDDVDTVGVTQAIEKDVVSPTTATPTTRVMRRGRQPRKPNSGITACPAHFEDSSSICTPCAGCSLKLGLDAFML